MNKFNFFGIGNIIYFVVLYIIYLLSGVYNNLLIILGVGVYFFLLYKYDREFIVKYFYIIFYILSNILGVFIIEVKDKLYLTELVRYSYRKNSLLILVIAHIVFLEVIRILNRKNDKYGKKEISDTNYIISNKLKLSKINVIKLILFIICVVNICIFISIFNRPFFIYKVDRFIYKEKYLNPIVDVISNSYIYIMPIIAMYYIRTKDKRVILLIGSIFIILFWQGHKFAIFLELFYMILLAMINRLDYSKINKVLKKIVALICILLGFVVIQNFIVWRNNINDTISYFNSRIAQQGQLWWAMYNSTDSNNMKLNNIKDEFNVYFKSKVSEDELYNSGIYKIMRMTTPKDRFYRKIYSQKSRYVYSTQASIYYYFGEIGLIIFSILSAILYFIVIQRLVESIKNMKMIDAILLSRLFMITSKVLIQSDFDKLFSFQAIIIIIILIVNSIIYKLNRKHEYGKV